MYIAKIGGHTVMSGTQLILDGMADNKYTLLVHEVLKTGFRVEWLNGDNEGSMDVIPHSLFANVGMNIEVIEVSEDENEPNRAWLLKKGAF